MSRQDGEVLEYALLTVYYLIVSLGPPVYLLCAWRRTGSRRRLAIHAILLPAGLLAVAGGTGATFALIEVLRSPPVRTVFSRMSAAEYVIHSYWSLGLWSVWAAALFALVWGPAILAWRRLHPASFHWVTVPTSRRVRSDAERDFDDRPDAQWTALDAGGRRPDPASEITPPTAVVQPVPRTDYLLWLVLAAIPILGFIGLRLSLEDEWDLIEEVSMVTSWANLVVVGSVVLGWVGQEIAVRCGLRLSGRRRPFA